MRLNEGELYAENKVGNKKVFKQIAPFLQTNEYGIPTLGARPLAVYAQVPFQMEATVSVKE